MKPLERILAAASLAEVDRVPVMPVLLQQGARLLDVPLKQYFGEPTRLAEGQAALVERFGGDAVFAFPHIVQDTMPWGVGLDFHAEGPPSVNRMAINSYEDIANLPLPQAADHPYMRHTLEAASELARRYKGERLIVGALIGPFSLPSMLMGMGKALALLIHHRDAYERYYPLLRERMMDYTTRWARDLFRAGCDLVVVAEGMASATLLQEETFCREALPVLKEFCERVDGLLGMEMVGDAMPFMHHLRTLPVGAMLIGSSDPVGKVRQVLGAEKLIVGNINNLQLLHWEPERVEFEARRAIAAAGPGFALCNQGPEIPWHVSDENIEALVRAAARSFSKSQAAA